MGSVGSASGLYWNLLSHLRGQPSNLGSVALETAGSYLPYSLGTTVHPNYVYQYRGSVLVNHELAGTVRTIVDGPSDLARDSARLWPCPNSGVPKRPMVIKPPAVEQRYRLLASASQCPGGGPAAIAAKERLTRLPTR